MPVKWSTGRKPAIKWAHIILNDLSRFLPFERDLACDGKSTQLFFLNRSSQIFLASFGKYLCPWTKLFRLFSRTSTSLQRPLCFVPADSLVFQVSYFHFRFFLCWIGGGGSNVFERLFVKGNASTHSRKWEGHKFFRQKFWKYPGPHPY